MLPCCSLEVRICNAWGGGKHLLGGRSVTVPKGSGLLPLCRSSPAGENELFIGKCWHLDWRADIKVGFVPLDSNSGPPHIMGNSVGKSSLGLPRLNRCHRFVFQFCAHISILCTHQHYKSSTPIRVLCTHKSSVHTRQLPSAVQTSPRALYTHIPCSVVFTNSKFKSKLHISGFVTFAELTLIASKLCYVRLITERLIFPLAVDECDNLTFWAGPLTATGDVPLRNCLIHFQIESRPREMW